MKIRLGTWTRIGLVVLAVGLAPWGLLRAQNFLGPVGNLTGGGILPLPPPPPRGAWGEVIFANEKWIVIQNHDGQQFPIAATAINQFLVRWPSSLSALTNQSWVEVMGADFGSNTVQTSHIDVYEGADRTLVQPTYKSILTTTGSVLTTIDPTYQRLMNAWDIVAQNRMYGWAYPINPGGNGIPSQYYAVGNALSLNPLRLGLPGNNFCTVLPDAAGNLSVSQVTRGTTTFAQKGDYAFLTPVDLNTKTLILAQLVLYKKIPLSQFNP